MAGQSWPDDIHADSWCRLPLVRREDLPEAVRAIYDDRADPGGSSHAGLRGPGGVRLHSPRLAELSRAASDYLRNETGLSPRIREVAILVTAREFDSRFEWQQHERVGRRVGVPDATIEAIKHRRPVDGLDATDALVIRFGRELLRERRVSSDLFAEARRTFGEQKLVDLLSNMGAYAATAILLAAVDMQLPTDEEPLLPVP
jgi:4-carboxymuconolactone decarboxylase